MRTIPPPSEFGLNLPVRKALGCISKEPVKIGCFFIQLRGYLLDYHDLYHVEVSCLERIQIGEYMVSGIHGINSPILHDSPIIEEYDGILDKARVAIHEWLTRLSIFSSFKLIFWIFWLITQRINPIAVIIRHARSMKRHQSRIAQLANVTLGVAERVMI